MKCICVYAASNIGRYSGYKKGAQALGRILVNKGIRLVYGGSKMGLMGTVADEVLNQGGQAIGVMPRSLFNKEINHERLTQFIEVDTMHERKAKMGELAEGFVALPGGLGTFEELIEVFSWSQIGIHKKPIGLLNINNYFSPFLHMIEASVEAGFAQADILELLIIEEDPETLIEKMMDYERPKLSQKQQ
ncbi:cytokinin riboside 5'-monophosphate phosphoribohydrolase [Pullulanibacillus camelliae]|uniref:Cytokinin riboside 5'-monophosphate phosphoribohydrolase n=1 Tax=Pullulanibacillus camelliae TaxID=1707096 RepID=A0A8J2YGQ3_9BACL|nr:TIGR00730 family Rossman fold protein [Pullulanibacillus camelliae]GGE37115.1 cytokinin riboside 5'-monophosphate phosphoribohydrolase [Pullulanibacillus camelliae]